MQFNGEYSSYNGHGEGEIRIWDKQLFVHAFAFSHKCLCSSENFASASKNTNVLRAKTRMLLGGKQKFLRENTKHLLE